MASRTIKGPDPQTTLKILIFIGLCFTGAASIYIIRQLVFTPFDPYQVAFVIALVLFCAGPGAVALEKVSRTSRSTFGYATATAMILPLVLCLVIRESFAYKLQLLEAGSLAVSEAPDAFSGMENRLLETARSSKGTKVPLLASVLWKSGKTAEAESLLLKSLRSSLCAPNPEGENLSIPLYMSLKGTRTGNCDFIVDIYNDSPGWARKQLLHGVTSFLRGLSGSEDWPRLVDLDMESIGPMVESITEWLSAEALRADGSMVGDLITSMMDLPMNLREKSIFSVLEGLLPSHLDKADERAGRLSKADRAGVVIAAINPSFYGSLESPKPVADSIAGHIRALGRGAIEALRTSSAQGWTSMIPEIVRTLAWASIGYSRNSEVCNEAIGTLRTLGMEVEPGFWDTRENMDAWLIAKNLLGHGNGRFAGALAETLVELRPSEGIRALKERLDPAEARNNGRPEFIKAALSILSRAGDPLAVDLAREVMVSMYTSQSLKRAAAKAFTEMDVREMSELLAECSEGLHFSMDDQTRSILADAARKLSDSTSSAENH